jgi:dCMP deaminase
MCDIIAEKSKDPSTKVGAVIVGQDNEVVSTGFNGFPRGAIDKPGCTCLEISDNVKIPQQSLVDKAKKINARYQRPLKYKWTEHAERNAIYNAARIGSSLRGCRIYINSLPPCCDCARAIIQSGINEVIITKEDVPERWKEDCSIAIEMLKECGVKILKVDKKYFKS